MSDDKESDERDQIIINNEEKVSNVIEVLKLGKLSSQKIMDNPEKEYNEINRMEISDDKDCYERYQISKND